MLFDKTVNSHPVKNYQFLIHMNPKFTCFFVSQEGPIKFCGQTQRPGARHIPLLMHGGLQIAEKMIKFRYRYEYFSDKYVRMKELHSIVPSCTGCSKSIRYLEK